MLQLVGGVGWINVDHDCPGLERAIEGDHKLRRIWQHQGYPIAFLEALADQRGGKAISGCVELTIRERTADG